MANLLLINDQCSYHIETSQLIYRANQLTGFYVIRTLVVKKLVVKRRYYRCLAGS